MHGTQEQVVQTGEPRRDGSPQQAGERRDYISLTQAAKLAPGRPSINCLWRWARRGVIARSGARIRLQHVRIGGKLFTTSEWMSQFGQALAEADVNYFDLDSAPVLHTGVLDPHRSKPALHRSASPTRPTRPTHSTRPARTDAQRQAAIERAERELKGMGV